MPIFEYICKDCARQFEAVIYSSDRAKCPECSGNNLEQQLSTFAVGTGRNPAPQRSGGCGTCGDPRGPGACSMN